MPLHSTRKIMAHPDLFDLQSRWVDRIELGMTLTLGRNALCLTSICTHGTVQIA